VSSLDIHLYQPHSERYRASENPLRSIAMIVLAMFGSAGVAGFGQTAASAPYTIRMGDRQRTSIGFVYSPALLAELVAQQPEEERPPLIVRAVAQGTPVVVMWSIPFPQRLHPRLFPPWEIAVLPSGNPFGTDKIARSGSVVL
jgi:hypothetical protein